MKKFVVDDKGEEYNVGSGPIETMVGEIIRDCRALDPKKRPSVSGKKDGEETMNNIVILHCEQLVLKKVFHLVQCCWVV